MIGFAGIYNFSNKVSSSESKNLLGQGLLKTSISKEIRTNNLSFYAAGEEFSFISKNNITVVISGNIYGIGRKRPADYVLNKYNKKGLLYFHL